MLARRLCILTERRREPSKATINYYERGMARRPGEGEQGRSSVFSPLVACHFQCIPSGTMPDWTESSDIVFNVRFWPIADGPFTTQSGRSTFELTLASGGEAATAMTMMTRRESVVTGSDTRLGG